MSECIFCRIIEGEIPADTVYEDEDVIAFMDANPLVEGHTLVVPRQHVERIGSLSPEQAGRYFQAVPAIVRAVQRVLDAEGATLAWNDGAAAGQEVPHAHLHIVPRYDGDAHGPIHALFGGQDADADTTKVAETIRDQLSG